MSQPLETRLREALSLRAEYAMTHTDTDQQLREFRGHLAGNRRSRRTRISISMAATAAVAGAAIGAVLVTTGGSKSPKPTPPGTQPTGKHASLPTLPSDYPLGSWQRLPRDQQQATLAFFDNGTVVLRDFLGQNTEPLAFPAPHEITFGASLSREYCSTAGTYRFAVTNHTLRFQLVGSDTCGNRTDYLLGHAWKFTG